jgi:hypothetical protein
MSDAFALLKTSSQKHAEPSRELPAFVPRQMVFPSYFMCLRLLSSREFAGFYKAPSWERARLSHHFHWGSPFVAIL